MRTLAYGTSGNTASDDDGAGTVLTKLYDSTDRLAEVKNGAATVAAYLHNAQGQRVAKTVGAAVTHYIYDLGGNLIAEADGGTGGASAEYVALEGKPLAWIATGAIYWVHGDHLGTPQVLTDAAGAAVWDATYRPFGEATVSGAPTFNLRFPGQYEDAETGSHYNYFRDYDPATGRYIQSDPIGLRGGWNTFAYVGGNPVMLVDPEGLITVNIRAPNPNKTKPCPVKFDNDCRSAKYIPPVSCPPRQRNPVTGKLEKESEYRRRVGERTYTMCHLQGPGGGNLGVNGGFNTSDPNDPIYENDDGSYIWLCGRWRF